MAARDPDKTDDAARAAARREAKAGPSLPSSSSSVGGREVKEVSAHRTLVDETERSIADALPLRSEIREAVKRGGVFPAEADTLTAHGTMPVRHDTMPAPPIPRAPTVPPIFPPPRQPARAPLGPPPVRESREERSESSKMRIFTPPTSMMLKNDPLDSDDLEDDFDDDTQTEVEPYTPASRNEDPTSPTLALANRSDTSREVYRLFLASEYAPALSLANELISQGDDDPILITIARECRSSIMNPSSFGSASSAPPSSLHGQQKNLFARVNGKMTLEQLAAMTGMSLDQVLNLLERFVAMGVLTLRPPPR